MASLFNVPNKTMLLALGNHAPGEVAYCEEEKEYMIYRDEEWQHIDFEPSSQGITMSAYDINKQVYGGLPPITDLSKYRENLNDKSSSDYWLLYGKEIGYFTLFKYRHGYDEDFYEVFVDCLSSVAKEIKGIEFLDDGATEIWIKTEDDIITVLYLFDYMNGVVYYG